MAGLLTFGSSPVHGGELARSPRPDWPSSSGALGFPGRRLSPRRPLLSEPGRVLVSASTPENWAAAQQATADPLGPDRLRKVNDVLAQG
ncbi:hypothetical protein ABZY81_27915 [Streptomyces sp. NPDC006514]|uniref:hypothetical protein n=1 Tax=Streptomyces sp. NPDC006514 TaxID=3154308 RepID=UPI0033B0C611